MSKTKTYVSQHSEFAFHRLNTDGIKKAIEIANAFNTLATFLEDDCCLTGCREFRITMTKLEEACFFAKKAMAIRTELQFDDSTPQEKALNTTIKAMAEDAEYGK